MTWSLWLVQMTEALKIIELLRDNIALVEPTKPSVPSTASEVLTPLTMETVLSYYSNAFADTIGKLGGELHLYTKQDINPHKTAPREILRPVKNNFVAEVKSFKKKAYWKSNWAHWMDECSKRGKQAFC